MIKITMMLLKHQQINLKNGNTSNTEEINNTSSGENNNTPENTTSEESDNTSENKNSNETVNTNSNSNSSSVPVEKTLATFSTKIYSKDSARQNNIKITCNSLNNTTQKTAQHFLFVILLDKLPQLKDIKKLIFLIKMEIRKKD